MRTGLLCVCSPVAKYLLGGWEKAYEPTVAVVVLKGDMASISDDPALGSIIKFDDSFEGPRSTFGPVNKAGCGLEFPLPDLSQGVAKFLVGRGISFGGEMNDPNVFDKAADEVCD